MDYIGTLVSLFGGAGIFLLSLILLATIYGAIKGMRGEILKFFMFLAVFGLSFLTTVFVRVIIILIFCFYYGFKIYGGIKKGN